MLCQSGRKRWFGSIHPTESGAPPVVRLALRGATYNRVVSSNRGPSLRSGRHLSIFRFPRIQNAGNYFRLKSKPRALKPGAVPDLFTRLKPGAPTGMRVALKKGSWDGVVVCKKGIPRLAFAGAHAALGMTGQRAYDENLLAGIGVLRCAQDDSSRISPGLRCG